MRKIITILVLSLLFGCSQEFIETNPKGALASGNFWQTAADANLGLTGCYDALQDNFLYALRNMNQGSLRDRENFTDNAMNGFLYQRYNNIKDGTLNPSDEVPIGRPWGALYKVIGRTNQVIANVPQIEDISDQEKNMILAQAKAIRALAYWNLIYAWDDVPLITTLLGPNELEVPKNSAMEIYNQIVTDLEEAGAVLPEVWTGNNYGKVTSGAVYSLLARIYLYAYGYLDVTNAAQKAADASEKVINSGVYSLFPNYAELFTPVNEDASEIIWSVRFTAEIGGNNEEGFSHSMDTQPQAITQPLPNLVDSFYAIDGLPISESPLYNAEQYWLNRDPRWDATLVYPGEKWLDNKPAFNLIGGLKRTGYAIDKYIISDNGGVDQGNGGQDWYIVRYADVLLMRAEALIETGSISGEVYTLIDMVRQRAGMPTIEEVEGTALSSSELTEILRHERRVELAFENTRFYDLKRWGIMEEAYQRSANDKKPGGESPILTGVMYQGERSIILPIPQNEIDINKALLQHPAW